MMILRKRGLGALVMLGTALSACTMAPAYRRGELPVAETWPVDAPAASNATINWRGLFTDPQLQATIQLALEQNRDLRVAALNIDKARAQYGITGAALFPTINGAVGESQTRTPGSVSTTGATVHSESYSANLGIASYEVDVFGRIRSLKNAAVDSFFAARDNRNAVEISLIAQVATAWLTVAADQDALHLAQQTQASYDDALTIANGRAQIGVASGLDVSTAQVQAQQARADAAGAATKLDQDKAALTLLVGAPVTANLLPSGLKSGLVADTLPVGLPSDVLLARPDVLSAEDTLKSANANIGAARAAFFPRIALTGSTGSASKSLGGLFDPGSNAYSFTPQISIPIFAGGANVLGLKSAVVSRDIALAQYEKAIQMAFSDVSSGLAVRDRIDERLSAQQAATDAAQLSETLSEARYKSGTDSYLTLLIAQRTLYASQQSLIALNALKATNLAALYKALGNDESLK